MPTGYTADLYEGKKEVTFEKFVLQCARAFMPSMREEPMDAVIPDKFPPSNYHKREIASAKREISKWSKLTLAQAAKMLKAQKKKTEAYEKKIALEQKDIWVRYHNMMSKLEHWKIPAELEGLKKFMIEQLSESMRFDCSAINRMPEPKEEMLPEVFRHQMLESAKRSLAYHTKEYAQAIIVSKQNEAWVKALKQSVKGIK